MAAGNGGRGVKDGRSILTASKKLATRSKALTSWTFFDKVYLARQAPARLVARRGGGGRREWAYDSSIN